MSVDGKIHIILVGVQPDYNNLYVKYSKEFCRQGPGMRAMQTGDGDRSSNDGKSGGAEYGQIP